MINQGFTFAVAPMMDWTDRHCRMFHRMLSKQMFLYSEMVVADAVIHGNKEYLLGFHAHEQPVALQVGGANPAKLARAAKIGADYGYAEINLNVGCPSDRVQAGRFGASLMAEPELVAECFTAMQEALMQASVDIPVTIKCRVGIDEQVPQEVLPKFIETVSAAGCKQFIIHARKAWLKGLSPKENRTVPPLEYGLARDMKTQFPDLTLVLNGGLQTLEQAKAEIGNLDGVMLGRAAYHNPWLLSRVDEVFFGAASNQTTRSGIVQNLITYAEQTEATDPTVKALTRHIMGLFHGEKGARIWRRSLSEADRSLSTSQRIENAYNALVQANERAA